MAEAKPGTQFAKATPGDAGFPVCTTCNGLFLESAAGFISVARGTVGHASTSNYL